MLRRIQQFINAITAHLNAADEGFLSEYLTTAEQNLFRQLTLPDQQHAIHVAYTVRQLAQQMQSGCRLHLLIRAALLHDIGRTQPNLSTADKIFAVLFSVAFPNFSRQWAKQVSPQRSYCTMARFQQVLFIYYHHGQIGANRLREIGVEPELLELVAKHHQANAVDDDVEMSLLRQADQLN